MPTLQINGKSVHWHDGGVPWRAGRPRIAMVHGAGGTHVVWQPQSRALAHAGYNVFVPDLPGHGLSDDDPALVSVEDLAAWLRTAIAAVSQQYSAAETPLILAGHSMGACIATTYAATWPQDVAALALVGASLEMKVNGALLKDCLDNQPQAVAFITSFGHGRLTHLAAATTPGAWTLGADRALMLDSLPPVLQRDFAMCATWRGATHAPKVRCPTIVVSGVQDRMTPARAGKQLADAIPGARYELVAGSGHMLMSEAPRPLLLSLQTFLRGLSLTRAA
jgi:pimeloyl-ACP methyl ester carboxylesterase